MPDPTKKQEIIIGKVTEAFPNILFKVMPENGAEEFLAYLSGKMRMHKIRILVGDSVEVEIDPYGGKGRIIRRL
jgi:translation initiation factor IF-1